MRIKTIITALLFGLLPFSALADDCSPTYCVAPIKVLYTTTDGTVYVQLDLTPQEESALNCMLNSGVYFTLDLSSSPYAKSAYAMLLAAAHTGHPVGLRSADNSNGCVVSYVTETF